MNKRVLAVIPAYNEEENIVSTIEDLRKNAPGEVFFDTAEQLILCGGAETLLPQIIEAGTLRPAAQVFTTEELRPAEGLNAYLNAHGGSVTVGDVTAALARSETVALPEVGADGE